jgi:hypothetical protein
MYLFQDLGIRLELPEPWRAASVPQHRAIIVYDNAEGYVFPNDPQELQVSLIIRSLERPLAADLTSFATATMQRHVKQGEPVGSSSVIRGVPALMFEWTDGVAHVVTWFVEPSAKNWLRIDFARKPTASGGIYRYAQSAHSEATQLLSYLHWA